MPLEAIQAIERTVADVMPDAQTTVVFGQVDAEPDPFTGFARRARCATTTCVAICCFGSLSSHVVIESRTIKQRHRHERTSEFAERSQVDNASLINALHRLVLFG